MKSQPLYEKAWSKFRDFFPCSLEFDTRMPSEEQFSTYFRFLRPDKGFSTSTLWTTYSMLNSVCKGKYSKSLNSIQVFDVDVKKKAHIFTKKKSENLTRLRLSQVHIGLFGNFWLLSPFSEDSVTLRS